VASAEAPVSLTMSFGCRSSVDVGTPSPVPIPYPNLIGVLVREHRGACHPLGVQPLVNDRSGQDGS